MKKQESIQPQLEVIYLAPSQLLAGSLHPNFKLLKTGASFCIERYAFGVYRELFMVLKGLIEES